MCKSNKCCFITSSTFLSLGFLVLIFSVFIFESLISSGARNQVILSENNKDAWATMPGKSKVQIYQKFYFYNVKDVEKIPFTNDRVEVNEIGPFYAKEFTQKINRKYEQDGNIVGFNILKYLDAPEEELKNQEENLIKTLNLVRIFII